MQGRLKKVLDQPWARKLVAELELLDARSRTPACKACRCDMGAAAAEVNVVAESGVHPAAAVLAAFGRRPHLFPGSYYTMTAMLTCEILVADGLTLAVRGRELATFLDRVRRGAPAEAVETWLLGRVRAPVSPHLLRVSA